MSKYRKVKQTIEVESIDIPSMYEMSDDEYREYLAQEGVCWVDHHGSLRGASTGEPFATTREQVDMLIKHLKTLRGTVRDDPEPNRKAWDE